MKARVLSACAVEVTSSMPFQVACHLHVISYVITGTLYVSVVA